MRLINFVLINLLIMSNFKMRISANDTVWAPLETFADLFSKYTSGLGAYGVEWIEVPYLDDDTLDAIPQPVHALLLQFPITENYESFVKDWDKWLAEKGQYVSENVFFFKQYIANAEGAIGIMHALGNNRDRIELNEDSILNEFIKKTDGMTPDARGEALIHFRPIATIHEQIAFGSQQALPEDMPATNFLALVNVDGNLYEFDGRLNGPINHGPTSADTFFKTAAKICSHRMNQDPAEHRFKVLALANTA